MESRLITRGLAICISGLFGFVFAFLVYMLGVYYHHKQNYNMVFDLMCLLLIIKIASIEMQTSQGEL